MVAWDAVEGATDYDVNYKELPNGRWTNWKHGIALTATITGLNPLTEYRWAVRAENSDGPSDWSFGQHVVTDPTTVEIVAEPDELIEPTLTPVDPVEQALFENACLEVHTALEELFENDAIRTAGREVKGKSGYAYVRIESIQFFNYSISNRFKISGSIRTGWRSFSDGYTFPTRGHVWVQEIGSEHRGFFIGTKHTYELDRRGRFMRFVRGEFRELGKEFLAAIENDLIESLRVALNASRGSSEAYVDGDTLDWWGKETPTFIHTEYVGNDETVWYFEYYCPIDTKRIVISGEISGINVNTSPAIVQGNLFIQRVVGENEELHPNTVGLNGNGARAFSVQIDVALGDNTEGMLSMANGNGQMDVSHYYWSLDELEGGQESHQYTWEIE